MARYERKSLEQGEFLAININEQFDDTSREYHIRDFVNRHVDLKLFDAFYKNDETGRTCKDPRDMIAAILYGYCTGNRASRKIEDLLQTHIGFMYVSNRLRADHSVICDFKTRFREEVTRLFSVLLYILNNLDEIDWDLVVGDGTKIKANAGKWRNVGGEFTEKKLTIYREMARKIIARDLELEEKHSRGEITDKSYRAEKPRISRQKKLYDVMIEKIEEYKRHVEAGELDGKARYNLIDPDSRVMPGANRRSFIQGYNAKMMISNNDIIIDYQADTKPEKNSGGIMIERVEDKKKILGVASQSKYLLDSGFEDMRTILDGESEGLDLYIDVKERSFSRNVHKRKYFHELEKQDDGYYLRCVGGRKIKGSVVKGEERRVVFSFWRTGCTGCSNYLKCYENISERNKQKTVCFDLMEFERRDEIDKYLSKLRGTEGQKIYHKRIGKEHNFANIKTQKGYFQTVYRGITKVNMELSWIALAHNIMKYAKLKLSTA